MNLIDLDEDKYKIIPHNWMATHHYSIKFEGWNGFSIDANDPTLLIIIKLARNTLNSFVKIYKETHAFTHPELCFRPDIKTFILKIGTMEIELYDDLKEKRELNESQANKTPIHKI
jgi:hypothetical protein